MTTQGYKDPTQEKLNNGLSVAAAMRGRGLKGVIVSPAGVDGRATNFDPHDKNKIDIHVVNPDGSNIHSLHLAEFTKDAIRQAVDAARTKVPGNDIEAIRERAAMAFEELAAVSGSGVVKKQASANPAAVNPPPVPPAAPQAVAPEIDRAYSPMAAFGLKRSDSGVRVPPAPSAARKTVGPPTRLVYFEKEGIGTVPAFFHEVITELSSDDAESGFIVLIYDLGFEQAAARWFPPADDPYKRPWAVQIQNENRLYLVHTTGFQFAYDGREFCLLRVEKSVNSKDV